MLVAAIVFVAFVISRYDLCFQDGELLQFDRPALRTGLAFSLGDLETAFDVYQLDGDSRPRFISYLTFIVSLKTRLALWHYVPPHPSFSPTWLLTLGLGPWLLFKALKIALGHREAALAGVAIYLVSTGCLSGVAMLFHPAKPLSNVLIIAVFYLSVSIDRAVRDRPAAADRAPAPPRWSWAVLLTLLAISPFVDEIATFAYFIPLLWCPYLFLPARGGRADLAGYARNWIEYAAPVVVAGSIIFVIVPRVVVYEGTLRFDFVEYLTRMAQWQVPRQGFWEAKFSLLRLVWHTGNLLIPQLLPWRLAHVLTPVADPPSLPVVPLLGLAAAFAAATRSVFRHEVLWRTYRTLVALAALFVVFLTCSFIFHDLELSATGFYYGCVFSVIFSALAAVVFAGLQRSRAGVWAARALLAWVLAISAVNFLAIDRTWNAHSNYKSMEKLAEMNLGVADLRPVRKLFADVRRPKFGRDPASKWYSADVKLLRPADPFGDAMAIWRSWRRGDADFVGDRPVSVRNAWIILELRFNQLGRGF